MKDLVLALNAGSSSIKASLLEDKEHLLHALGERLGTDQSRIHLEFASKDPVEICEPNIDHERALKEIVKALKERAMLDDIAAVCHRVVHGGGGTEFSVSTTIIDSTAVLERIESVSHLAPL
jgi:acetate kinase